MHRTRDHQNKTGRNKLMTKIKTHKLHIERENKTQREDQGNRKGTQTEINNL